MEQNVKTGWRPIETAPDTGKDGPYVDIWLVPDPEREPLFSHKKPWKPRRLTDAWFNGSAGAGWRNWESYNGRERNWIATHWRPLPAPPTPDRSGEADKTAKQGLAEGESGLPEGSSK